MSAPEPITSPHMPDLEQVQAWLEKMVKSMKFIELIAAVISLVTRMSTVNAELLKQVTNLRRRRPRSETFDRVERQSQFAFMGSGKRVPVPDAENKEQPTKKPKRNRKGRHPGRASFPPHLERVPELNRVPPALRICPRCGSEMTTVGHSVCEILEVIPARVVVIQRQDERVACPHDQTIVSAPTPPQLVERGKLGMKFIVESMADKYLEHLPVERQCLRWEREGVDIAPQTLGRSVAVNIDLLKPLAKLIAQMTRGPGILSTDSTGIPVLDKDAPDGIRTGTIWCWINAKWVTYDYAAQGNADSMRRFLGPDLARDVQCDGANVANFVERAGGRRPGCWSHGRRGLVEVARAGDPLGLEPLRKIRRLFAVERLSRLAGDSPEQRLARRLQYSKPVIDELRVWLDAQRPLFPPKSLMGRALGYLHRQWHRLILFLTDGRIELTNNHVERALRKLVLGRKNWLFVWEDVGGERTASILTVVATCVAHGINPRAYLHVVTKLLVDGWSQTKIRELLPDRIALVHPELKVPTRPQELHTGAAPPLLSS